MENFLIFRVYQSQKIIYSSLPKFIALLQTKRGDFWLYSRG